MQVSSATPSTAKPPRSKAKGAAAEAATGAIKPTRTRKKAAPPVAEATAIEVIAVHPTADEVSGMIATAAYFIAAERHFAAGHELDDWLEAERVVRAQFSG